MSSESDFVALAFDGTNPEAQKIAAEWSATR
jgi:hypothetical protein